MVSQVSGRVSMVSPGNLSLTTAMTESWLLCTFLPRVDARDCYLRFCRDPEFNFLPSSKQQRRVEYLSRHGWVVDKHIENSPQIVMKRISGYVAEIFDPDTAP